MKEYTAGIIVFRKEKQEILYLLLYYAKHHGYWGFSKGHLEGKETEFEAALRELKEETGITKIRIIDGFERKISYSFKKEEDIVSKEVTFFLAETYDEKVVLSEEHSNYIWVDYKKALNMLFFDNSKNVLKEINLILKEVNYKNP